VDYADGIGLVTDLVDLYAGDREVVVLVDGSDERSLEQLVGAPYGLAKLTQPIALPATVPADQWRRPLAERFSQAQMDVSEVMLDSLLDFGAEQPYPTMCGAFGVALKTRQMGSEAVTDLSLRLGLEEARARLEADF
jgi:hypothetical protein